LLCLLLLDWLLYMGRRWAGTGRPERSALGKRDGRMDNCRLQAAWMFHAEYL
jgi:hypothetical protein